ncbi:hypothetical protein BY458DRAFT_503104 [Sporodiniella umbellata]|nr:hypothetical protein BY458DRAFT_503104 [Sporodiniella umbellata]
MSTNIDKITAYRPVAAIVVVRKPIFQYNSEQTDVHSFSRKPEDILYLLVKKPRENHSWQFPQGGIKLKKRKESLKEAALRELSEECGDHIQVNVTDEQPLFVCQYDFPADFVQKKKRNYKGAQVQFLMGEWASGQCEPDDKEIVDFAWLTCEEITQYVSGGYWHDLMSAVQEKTSKYLNKG